MADSASQAPVRPRGIALRVLVSTTLVFVLVGVSLRSRGGGVLAYWSHANFIPHAPNLALIAAAPPAIKLHLAAAVGCIGIGLVQLVGPRGTLAHRTLGWIWVVLVLAAALSSLFIRNLNHGSLSYIHILAGVTLVSAPLGVYFARTRRIAEHGRTMTALFFSGLLLAGALAFLPGRLLWQVFFG